MKDATKTVKFLKYFGILAVVIYWLFVAWSISVNPWFSFFTNALSDLGAPARATSPWIYNYGLIITSLLMFAFSIYILLSAENKLKTISGAYISIAAVFIGFIGVFHGGTSPHSFVSVYFFIQFFIGILVYALGSENKVEKYASLALFALALVGALIHWPSVALIETYEISVIMLFTLLVAFGEKLHA